VTVAPRLLVADDQPDVLEAVRMLARSDGFDVRTATSPAAVLALCETEEFDVCVLDLNYARDTTSGREGMDLLARLREVDPALPIVVMTAWGSIEGAIEAIRRGARDYLQKPWDNARLLATLHAQLELRNALRTANRLDAEAARTRAAELPAIVARSRAMQQVMSLVERVAPSSASILITGEHGTGKEVLARAIHASSERYAKAFVAVNAGGLSDGVLESELFGHVKGAFTDARSDRTGCFELADGGTLFLDEIANMPHGQQARLLRVLQTGEFHPVGSSRPRKVDVRVLAATNADVVREAAAGRLREDLLYRLNTVEIRVPCASAATTSPTSRAPSSASRAAAASAGSRPPPWRPSSPTPGRATSASSSTSSSAPASWPPATRSPPPTSCSARAPTSPPSSRR
jgi:DNA-binding NtrC family response regulator